MGTQPRPLTQWKSSLGKRHRWIKGGADSVSFVRLRERPFFIKEVKRRKGPKRDGQRYEAKIHEIFGGRYGERWLPGPWFEFHVDLGAVEYCQPDALFWHPAERRVVVCEVKLQHTTDGFEQLHGLYLPVVQAWLGWSWTVTLCEIVRWYRPEIQLPVSCVMADSPDNRRTDSLSVHICNPQREKRR